MPRAASALAFAALNAMIQPRIVERLPNPAGVTARQRNVKLCTRNALMRALTTQQSSDQGCATVTVTVDVAVRLPASETFTQ